MKIISFVLVSVLAITSGLFVFQSMKPSNGVPTSVVEKYQQWRAKHRKLYATPSENQFRLRVFQEKLNMVEQGNKDYESELRKRNLPAPKEPMFSLKSFSDLTTEEFKKKFTGLDLSKAVDSPVEEIDDSVIPVPSLASSPSLGQTPFQIRVRSQGECGSCWAFSTVATSERKYYEQTKQQLDLSHQELVDCSDQDNGCDGGWPYTTYSYVKKYGLSLASQYPYQGSQNYCERDSVKRVTFDSTFAPRQITFSVAAAQSATNAGIIGGICVFSSGKFSHVSSSDDIYDASLVNECSNTVDHAVNVAGAGANYVVILNSWGFEWGNNGLKKIKPCSVNNLIGTPSLISHVSANFS